MLASTRIEDIDQLLNELEQLARSNSPRSRFLNATLERLRFLLNASATAVVMKANAGNWMPVAVNGPIPIEMCTPLLALATDSSDYCCTPERQLLAIPIRREQWQRGALVIAFREPVHAGELVELIKLGHAFAEVIAIRQTTDLENLIDHKWSSFQKSLSQLSNASSRDECAFGVVNDVAALLQADRVSLAIENGWGSVRNLAVSGVIKPESKATVLATMEKLCQQAMRSQHPISQFQSPPQVQAETDAAISTSLNLLPNYVCIPIVSKEGDGQGSSTTAVLLEWHDYEMFLLGCTTLNYLFPPLSASWLQHQRWLRMPWPLRKMFDLRQPGRLRRWSKRLMRTAVLAVACLGLAWALHLPTELRIETEGTLQPVEQRMVFATLDGVVVSLFVSDGQQVALGEPLLEMRSPMLELDIQDVLGDIRANAEKRDGLNLAINQLSRDDPTAYGIQSRLSSEIRELEIQLATFTEKHDALIEEQKKLLIKSPLAGSVVARQIEKFLNSRPVRRGDALLRVVNLEGPWQLELLVRDQDSGYVKHKLFGQGDSSNGNVPAEADRELEFALASQPDVKFAAKATWMSESARNPTGQGVFVDVTADIDQAVPKQGHMGATVYAYFKCGRQPFWFVWTRPLVEAIQRKLWF